MVFLFIKYGTTVQRWCALLPVMGKFHQALESPLLLASKATRRSNNVFPTTSTTHTNLLTVVVNSSREYHPRELSFFLTMRPENVTHSSSACDSFVNFSSHEFLHFLNYCQKRPVFLQQRCALKHCYCKAMALKYYYVSAWPIQSTVLLKRRRKKTFS